MIPRCQNQRQFNWRRLEKQVSCGSSFVELDGVLKKLSCCALHTYAGGLRGSIEFIQSIECDLSIIISHFYGNQSPSPMLGLQLISF
jgi:hypothetical protein